MVTKLLRYPKTLVAAFSALVYLPTAFFGWVYLDDYLIVQEQGFYSKVENVVATFTRSVWLPSGGDYMYYRPVSTSLYVIDAWISKSLTGEVEAWPFHVTNILLVMIVAVLAYMLLRGLGAASALALTALLVAHPSSAPTVAWVSGQNEMLLAIFTLAAFVALTQRRFVAYALFFLGALLTKENAVAIVPLGAMLLYIHRAPRWALPFAFASLAAAMGWYLLYSQGTGQSVPSPGSALASMIAGAPYMLIFLGKLVLPYELNTLPIPKDTSVIIYIAGATAGLALVGLGLRHWRKRPLILFGVAWFIAFLWPTFGKMPPEAGDTFILRGDRVFLASIGLLIALVYLPKFNAKIVGAFIAILLALNVLHQFDYRDGMSFYANAAAKSPSLAFAHTHLGDMHLLDQDIPRAIARYEHALTLDDTELNAYNNLGVAYLRSARHDEALVQFDKELRNHPSNILAWFNAGSIHYGRGNLGEAERAFRKTVEINPAHRDAWRLLMDIYRRNGEHGKYEDAARNFQKADLDMSKGI